RRDWRATCSRCSVARRTRASTSRRSREPVGAITLASCQNGSFSDPHAPQGAPSPTAAAGHTTPEPVGYRQRAAVAELEECPVREWQSGAEGSRTLDLLNASLSGRATGGDTRSRERRTSRDRRSTQ